MTTFELNQRLIRLEQSLRDLETLQHEVHQEALALSQIVIDGGADDGAASAHHGDSGSRVSSVPEAARHLGISVSMVHKLLRERRLGHLKVGARTLITAEHLEEFLATTSVDAQRDTRAAGSPLQNGGIQRAAHDGAA